MPTMYKYYIILFFIYIIDGSAYLHANIFKDEIAASPKDKGKFGRGLM